LVKNLPKSNPFKNRTGAQHEEDPQTQQGEERVTVEHLKSGKKKEKKARNSRLGERRKHAVPLEDELRRADDHLKKGEKEKKNSWKKRLQDWEKPLYWVKTVWGGAHTIREASEKTRPNRSGEDREKKKSRC